MSYELELNNVAFFYGDTMVLDGLFLQVRQGEILGLCGPSGCGKTTSLKIAAGLSQPPWPHRGHVLVRGVDVTHTPPGDRHISMVFQRPVLPPYMRVGDIIAFRPRIAGVPLDKCRQLAAEAAERVGANHLLDRFPNRLSGGERQRIALAVALAHQQATVVLLDEPFNSLDPETRERFDDLTRASITESRKAAVFVTHDLEEARRVCDRIAHMGGGGIKKIELVERPELLN